MVTQVKPHKHSLLLYVEAKHTSITKDIISECIYLNKELNKKCKGLRAVYYMVSVASG